MVHVYGLDDAGLQRLQVAARIARDVAAPAASAVDEAGRFPSESLTALAEEGFYGLTVPAEAGGQGQGPGVFAAVAEELAKACGSTAMAYVMHVSATQALIASETYAERGRVLSEIAGGKGLTTLAFSEKGSRSQFWAPVSRMQPVNGAYATSANKSWVTSARHADYYVSSARAPEAASPLESVLYVARRADPAIRVVGDFNGLGLRGNDSAPVAYENLNVRREDFLTEPGAGAAMMLEVVLPWFSVGTSAMANGICLAAVEATAEHLGAAGFEHDGQKLRDLPNLRSRLAQMSVRTEQSRALLGHAIRELLDPGERTALYVLQARMAALSAAVDVTDLAMKACGGAAFSKHLGVERLFRDARAGWVMAPTADHLSEFVGRALTGLPLF